MDLENSDIESNEGPDKRLMKIEDSDNGTDEKDDQERMKDRCE